MEQTISDLSLFQGTPRHSPFALTGRRSYLVWFEDFIPDVYGRRLKDNMMGLWYPPYRILDSIYFVRDGEVVGANSEKITLEHRTFFFRSFNVQMSMDEETSSLVMNVNRRPGRVFSLDVHFRFSVIPAWGVTPEYSWKLDSRGRFPKLRINSGQLEVSFTNLNPENISISGNEVIIKVVDEDTIIIRRKVPIKDRSTISSLPGTDHEYGYSILSYNDAILNNAYAWAKVNMQWLYADYGNGLRCLTGGQPECPWFVTIDTFISLGGILSAGAFNMARNSLETLFFAADRNKGIMPHEILTDGTIIKEGGLEETAYMPIALKKYYDWTGDRDLIRELFDTAVRGYTHLLNTGLNGKGIMEDPNAGAGIDIDTVSYFVNGGRDLIELNRIIHGGLSSRQQHEIISETSRMEDFIKNEMWMSERNAFADRFADGVPLIDGFWTSVIPFGQNLASQWQYDRFIRSEVFREMNVEEGVKTEPTGAVTPVCNSLLVKSALDYGDTDTAWYFFRKNVDAFGKFSTACYPEFLADKPGCFLHSWSSALIVYNMVNGFLGVTPREGQFSAIPRMPKNLKYSRISMRNIRVGNELYSLSLDSDSYLSNGYTIEKIS